MANAAQHKDGLVQTAAKLFREQGYSATGLNEILKKSGAPKGSLYYYFPAGKEALGAAAVTLAGKVVSTTLLQLRSRSSNSAEFIEQYCTLLEGWMKTSNFKSGCPIATTLLETCPASEVIQKAGREVFENWVRIISDVFLDEGLGSEEARSRAVLIIAALEGGLILARASSSIEPINLVAKQLATFSNATTLV